jgi:hypothetical protein
MALKPKNDIFLSSITIIYCLILEKARGKRGSSRRSQTHGFDKKQVFGNGMGAMGGRMRRIQNKGVRYVPKKTPVRVLSLAKI